jgi:phosphocarrier protein HPr
MNVASASQTLAADVSSFTTLEIFNGSGIFRVSETFKIWGNCRSHFSSRRKHGMAQGGKPCSRVGLATAFPVPALVMQRMAAMSDTTDTKMVTVCNRQGIHARPAHAIATLASRFKANIEIVRDSTVADGKSVLAIMTLAAEQGTLLLLRASGEDAPEALKAVEQLIASGFGEDEDKHQATSDSATD